MKKTARADAVFVAVFALFVAIPNLHFSRAEVSTKENRTLATFKPLFTGGQFNEAFPADFEAFYADRFFGREVLLALSQTLTSRFVVSKETIGNERVLIGQEGWLFIRDNNSERNFMNIDYFTEAELSNILTYLTDIKAFCDERDKRFVFFIAPDKSKIYGEYYPALIKKQNPDTASRAFQLVDYIKQNSDVQVVYPWERLIREKSKGDMLYIKTGTHWTHLGSYFGYEELFNVLQVNSIDFFEYEEIVGDWDSIHDLFPEGTTRNLETVYRIPKIESSYSQVEKPDIFSSRKTSFYTECVGKGHNTVFFCDSFTWTDYGLKRYASNSFATVNYFRRYNIQNSDLDILNQADIIILSVVERMLPQLAKLHFPTFD